VERRREPTPPGPPGPKALVSSLHVTGERLYSEGELIAVAGFRPGSQLSLADLREMAGRITHFYTPAAIRRPGLCAGPGYRSRRREPSR